MIELRRQWLAAALLVAGIGVATQSQAAVLTFDYNLRFGAEASDGTPPWLRAVFEDVDADTVELTMSAPGLSTDTDGGSRPEYADNWWFNLDPALDPSALIFSHISGEVSDAPVAASDSQSAGSGGQFDIYFHFDLTGAGRSRAAHLSSGETSVYRLTGISGLNAHSFNFMSVPPGGNCCFLAAAHIQSTGPRNEGSDFVAPGVPEPGSIALIASALLAALRLRRLF